MERSGEILRSFNILATAAGKPCNDETCDNDNEDNTANKHPVKPLFVCIRCRAGSIRRTVTGSVVWWDQDLVDDVNHAVGGLNIRRHDGGAFQALHGGEGRIVTVEHGDACAVFDV